MIFMGATDNTTLKLRAVICAKTSSEVAIAGNIHLKNADVIGIFCVAAKIDHRISARNASAKISAMSAENDHTITSTHDICP